MASENDHKREKQCFQTLQSKQVDGLIVIGCAGANDTYDQWVQNGDIRPMPLVFINRMFDNLTHTRVLNDFYQGSYDAVEHFLSTGRRRIAMISGIPGLEESTNKERGFLNCLADHGVTPNKSEIAYGYYNFEEGFRAARYLLENICPDAILAVNDLSAIAVLSCANTLKLRVPEDLAVIGYGNSEASAFTSPALSTIDQDKRLSGQYGARLLLDLLAGKAVESKVVHTTLVLRNSC
jgi:DNA-binding LacI/PurR family transcriptional regulator